jgi:hypothetical protein
MGGHLCDVFNNHGGITRRDEFHHWRFDFRLPRSAYFVMVIFNLHAHSFQVADNFRPKFV